MNSIPPSIIILSFIFVVIPALIAVCLRWLCYRYLRELNHDLSRLLELLDGNISDRLSGIITKLHHRYAAVSLKTDRVNTIALVEVVYAEQRIRWPLGKISLERIDTYTRVLPNLLLSFGLIGTFIGITTNLVSLSGIINSTEASDISQLVTALKSPLEGMGIAFISSLAALLGSAFLVTTNLFLNIGTQKNDLLSGFEDYLDNIYQPSLNGDSKLDKSIVRMADMFDKFLIGFGESIKSAVEKALQDKIKEISRAYIKVSEAALKTYSHLDDASGKISQGADRIQSAALNLNQAVKEIHDSEFAQSLSKTTSAMGHNVREFEISSQRLSKTVESTEKLFAESGVSFSNAIDKLVNTQDGFVSSIDSLNHAANTVKGGTLGFQIAATELQQAAQSIKESEFVQSLAYATSGLKNTVGEFQSSSKNLADTIFGIHNFMNDSNSHFASQILDLGAIQNSFTSSSNNLNETVSSLRHSLVNKIEEISTSYMGIASLAGQTYVKLDKISDTMAESATGLQSSSLIFKESAQILAKADFDQSFKSFTTAASTMQECINGSNNLFAQSIADLAQVQSNFVKSSSGLDASVSTLHQTLGSLMTDGIQKISTSYDGITTLASQTYERLDKVFGNMDSSVKNIHSSSLVFQQTMQALDTNFQVIQKDFQVSTNNLQETFGSIDRAVKVLAENGHQSSVVLEKIADISGSQKLISSQQQFSQQYFSDVLPKFDSVVSSFQEISLQIARKNSDMGDMTLQMSEAAGKINSYIQSKDQSKHEITDRLSQAINQLNKLEVVSTSGFGGLKEAIESSQKSKDQSKNEISDRLSQAISQLNKLETVSNNGFGGIREAIELSRKNSFFGFGK
jgi:methyl-accepting chemotaxis protein